MLSKTWPHEIRAEHCDVIEKGFSNSVTLTNSGENQQLYFELAMFPALIDHDQINFISKIKLGLGLFI